MTEDRNKPTRAASFVARLDKLHETNRCSRTIYSNVDLQKFQHFSNPFHFPFVKARCSTENNTKEENPQPSVSVLQKTINNLRNLFVINKEDDGSFNKSDSGHPVSAHVKSDDNSSESSSNKFSLPLDGGDLHLLARKYIDQESGTNRLKMLFKKDPAGKTSTQLAELLLISSQTILMSFFGYSPYAYKVARETYELEHKATLFRHNVDYHYRMFTWTNAIAMRECTKFMMRVTPVTLATGWSYQLLSTYKNKYTATDLGLCAAFWFGLFKFWQGPRAMFSLAVIGGVGGSLLGLAITIGFRGTKYTQESKHFDEIVENLKIEKEMLGPEGFRRLSDAILTNEPLPKNTVYLT